jgi:hypothetical protein
MTATPTWRRSAAAFHLTLGVLTLVGIVWQLVLVIQQTDVLVEAAGPLPGTGTRVIRFFSYFTIQSNILVAVVSLWLAANPFRDGKVFRVVRLEALFGITVTGLVYTTLLRGVVNLSGAGAITNAIVHYIVPSATVVGWLVFGPRPRITDNTLLLSLIWPLLYVGYSFAHGAASDWYPYPFVDVVKLGYGTAVRNGIGVCVLLVGVGALFMWLDRRLPSAESLLESPRGGHERGAEALAGRTGEAFDRS